jgi:hypothetical protein
VEWKGKQWRMRSLRKRVPVSHHKT